VLLWQEWTWRVALPGVESLPAPLARVADERVVFNPEAIASVFGLVASDTLAKSTEALVVRASFVSSTGDSRAVLAGAEGERTYRIGDTLPGGSVLRRIDVGQVVLWRNGREELLSIDLPDQRSLLPLGSHSPGVLTDPPPVFFQLSTDSDPK
jgi:hypothetical protein